MTQVLTPSPDPQSTSRSDATRDSPSAVRQTPPTPVCPTPPPPKPLRRRRAEPQGAHGSLDGPVPPRPGHQDGPCWGRGVAGRRGAGAPGRALRRGRRGAGAGVTGLRPLRAGGRKAGPVGRGQPRSRSAAAVVTATVQEVGDGGGTLSRRAVGVARRDAAGGGNRWPAALTGPREDARGAGPRSGFGH